MASNTQENSRGMTNWEKGFQTVTVIHTAFFGTLVAFLAAVQFLGSRVEPIGFLGRNSNLSSYLVIPFFLASFIALFLIKVINTDTRKRLVFLEGGEKTGPMIRQGILTAVLCEVPANFGLVFFMLSGRKTEFYIFWGLSFFWLVVKFPKSAAWKSLFREEEDSPNA